MRLAHIVIPTTVILTGIVCLGVAFLPNFLGPFGIAKQLSKRTRKLGKKKVGKVAGTLFVLSKNTEDFDSILIPEIEHQTGMRIVTMYDGRLGVLKPDNYRELISNSSVTLIILTEDMLLDPWLRYAMAFCFQKDPCSVYLWCDEDIYIRKRPRLVKDAIEIGCRTVTFKTDNLRHPGVLDQLAKDLRENLLANVSGVSNTPVPIGLENFLKFDTFVIHDLGFDPCQLMAYMELNGLEVIGSTDIPPGNYIYQACSSTIRSSKSIIFVLTPHILKEPYFKYQLCLALHYKGHRSITFVLTPNCLASLPDDRKFRYAIATCRKIYIK